ncbi:MAG: DUF2891 domain-containing protein, partial [Pseudomonadota bacterium]
MTTIARRAVVLAALLGVASACAPGGEGAQPGENDRAAPVTTEDRFAILALDGVHRDYPNKINHVLQSAGDVAAP